MFARSNFGQAEITLVDELNTHANAVIANIGMP